MIDLRGPVDLSNPINYEHHLARDLAFCTAPLVGSFMDLVNFTNPTPLAGGGFGGATQFGQAVKSTSTSNGGVFYPWSQKIGKITQKYTFVIFLNATSLVDYSHLLGIPYRNGAWAPPYDAIALMKNSNSSALQFDHSIGGFQFQPVSTSGAIQTTDGLTLYGGTVNAATQAFYRNGLLHSTTSTDLSAGNADLSNKQPVCILNHSNSANGEAVIGTVIFAGIWSRAIGLGDALIVFRDFGWLSPTRSEIAKKNVSGHGGGSGYRGSFTD